MLCPALRASCFNCHAHRPEQSACRVTQEENATSIYKSVDPGRQGDGPHQHGIGPESRHVLVEPGVFPPESLDAQSHELAHLGRSAKRFPHVKDNNSRVVLSTYVAKKKKNENLVFRNAKKNLDRHGIVFMPSQLTK